MSGPAVVAPGDSSPANAACVPNAPCVSEERGHLGGSLGWIDPRVRARALNTAPHRLAVERLALQPLTLPFRVTQVGGIAVGRVGALRSYTVFSCTFCRVSTVQEHATGSLTLQTRVEGGGGARWARGNGQALSSDHDFGLHMENRKLFGQASRWREFYSTSCCMLVVETEWHKYIFADPCAPVLNVLDHQVAQTSSRSSLPCAGDAVRGPCASPAWLTTIISWQRSHGSGCPVPAWTGV